MSPALSRQRREREAGQRTGDEEKGNGKRICLVSPSRRSPKGKRISRDSLTSSGGFALALKRKMTSTSLALSPGTSNAGCHQLKSPKGVVGALTIGIVGVCEVTAVVKHRTSAFRPTINGRSQYAVSRVPCPVFHVPFTKTVFTPQSAKGLTSTGKLICRRSFGFKETRTGSPLILAMTAPIRRVRVIGLSVRF